MKIIKTIIAISLLLNNAGYGYALRPMASGPSDITDFTVSMGTKPPPAAAELERRLDPPAGNVREESGSFLERLKLLIRCGLTKKPGDGRNSIGKFCYLISRLNRETMLKVECELRSLFWHLEGAFFRSYSKPDMGISEDEDSVYIYLRGRGLPAAFLGHFEADHAYYRKNFRITKELRLSMNYTVFKIHFSKNEIDREALAESRREARIESLSEQLKRAGAEIRPNTEEEQALAKFLPLLARLIRLSDPELIAEAIRSFKEAPAEVARYAVDTFINYTEGFPLNENYYIGEGGATLPYGYYMGKYWHTALPIRAALIEIIGSQKMYEYTDRLFEFMDCTTSATTWSHSDHSAYTRERMKAAAALAEIAKIHQPTLDRLKSIVSPENKHPWWMKQAAIESLGQTEMKEDKEVVQLLLKAYEFDAGYESSVMLQRDDAVRDRERVKMIIVPDAISALTKLGVTSIKDELLANIAGIKDRRPNPFFGIGPIESASIRGLAYLGEKDVIPSLFSLLFNNNKPINARVRAIWAINELDPSNEELFYALIGIIFGRLDLYRSQGRPGYKKDLSDKENFIKFIRETILFIDTLKAKGAKEPGYAKEFMESARENAWFLLMDFKDLQIIDYIISISIDGKPEEHKVFGPRRLNWQMAGFALKNGLSLNPHSKEFLEALNDLHDNIERYDWPKPAALEELYVYGRIISELDYKYQDAIIAALTWADDYRLRSADFIDYREQIGKGALGLFGPRVFKDNQGLLTELFSPAEKASGRLKAVLLLPEAPITVDAIESYEVLQSISEAA